MAVSNWAVKLFLFPLVCFLITGLGVSQSTSLHRDAPGIIIQGRVLQDPQALPVRKATVQLNGPRGQEGYSAVTDAEGRFVIDDVKPGRYVVTVEHPGLVEMGRRRVLNTFSMADSELVLHLQAAAVITGKITDGDGDPVRDVSVMATRVGPSRGWHPHDASNGATNDLGEFRISDLRPGRYTVVATPPRNLPVVDPTRGGKGEGQLVYVPTYYPGTVDRDQSVAVDTQAGGETSINFSVLASKAYRVSGDVAGLPSNDLAQIMLSSAHGFDAEQQFQPGGKFEFPDLLPGTYRVQIIVASLSNGLQASMRILGVNTSIEVTNEDIHDLHLQLDQGASVRGQFRMDTGEKFDWTQLTVVLANVDPHGAVLQPSNGLPTFSDVGKGGTFEMKNVPSGKYYLVVGTRGSSSNLRDYFTKSVLLDGQEVGNSGFETNGGTNLEIVISAQGAAIEGTVVDEKGNPASSVMVLDVPDVERRARPDLYQQDTTDERGHFRLRGLNPGSYTVLAFEDLEESVQDPEFLSRYGSKGEKVEVGEGADKNIVLKVISADSE
jgi:uncharacterized protein (DUF2141 family)